MESVRANDKAAAEARFREMTKLADSAARKGVFHKNMVARKKSRMRRMLNKMGSAS
jgi:small subunit ribosomal protein S20